MPIDREAVERVIGLLADSDAAEIEIEDGDLFVRVARGEACPEPPAAPEPVPAEEVMQTVEPPLATEPAPASEIDGPALEYVTAGLVGLFHRGGEPDGDPMVEVGDEVREGQVVASIEALRKFTDVVSNCGGTVEEFFVEDGEVVQYGDRLFAIRPEEA